MEYMVLPVGVGIGYLAYRHLQGAAKLGEHETAVLEAKNPGDLGMDADTYAEPPSSRHDRFIPAHSVGKPKKVRMGASSKPHIY